jgi:hypothetical protein
MLRIAGTACWQAFGSVVPVGSLADAYRQEWMVQISVIDHQIRLNKALGCVLPTSTVHKM